jgi:predicted secreted protein
MSDATNPGPPARCFDDCPTNRTGNSEDCTCLSAGTTVDSDAALFARQRDDAQAIVLSVSRILGISHLADGLEHGRVTSTVRSWMDTAEQLTRERDAAGAEIGRLTKLAEANGGQARFWADHFAEIDKANRDALGAHHKPGHSVAELITALVGELDREKACYNAASEGRQHAWEQLERVSKLMGVAEDDFAVEAVTGEVERYIDQVKLVTDRVTRERDEAQQHLDKVRQALRTPDGWATKMHALRVRQQRDKAQAELASRPAIPADAVERS